MTAKKTRIGRLESADPGVFGGPRRPPEGRMGYSGDGRTLANSRSPPASRTSDTTPIFHREPSFHSLLRVSGELIESLVDWE